MAKSPKISKKISTWQFFSTNIICDICDKYELCQHWNPKPILPKACYFLILFTSKACLRLRWEHRIQCCSPPPSPWKPFTGRMKITTTTFLCQKLPIIGIFYFKITTTTSPCQKLPTIGIFYLKITTTTFLCQKLPIISIYT